jgi:hypothetical protein
MGKRTEVSDSRNRQSIKSVFTGKLKTTPENFEGLLLKLNRNQFWPPGPLARVDIVKNQHHAKIEFVTIAHLKDEGKIGIFGFIEITPLNAHFSRLNLNCYMADFNWAKDYYQSLVYHLSELYDEDFFEFAQISISEKPSEPSQKRKQKRGANRLEDREGWEEQVKAVERIEMRVLGGICTLTGALEMEGMRRSTYYSVRDRIAFLDSQ